MSIYTRDNLAASIAPGLASALDRAAAYRARQNERIRNSFDAAMKFAPIVGRTIEQGFTPDKYKDDNDYRAARYDYILNGDRSGLDAFRQREAQAAEAAKQRDFQASEAVLNRALQESEGNKNRALQQKQQLDNRTTEKARLLANIRTAQAIVQDAKDNEQKYTTLDKAKANSDLELNYDIAEKSGWFTDEEMRKIKGLPPEPPAPATVVPFKPGYTPEAAPAVTEVPAATGTPAGESGNAIIDWKNFKNDAKNAKTLDDIKSLRERAKGKQNEGNAEEYNDIVNTIDAKEKEIKNKMAAAAKKKARIGAAKTHKFEKGAIREILKMGEAGGGIDSGKIKYDYEYGGKTYTTEADIQKDRASKTAKIIVDGETVQTIPLN